MRIGVFQALGLIGRKRLLQMGRAKKRVWEELIGPHFMTRAIQTLSNVGFLDAIRANGSVDAMRFAQTHGLDERLLMALCEALLARDYFDREGTVFRLSAKGKTLVETDLARGWLHLAYGYENLLFHLEPLLRKEMIYGEDIVREGRAVAIGSGLASRDFYFTFVLKMIQEKHYKRILDIGCGDGHFLRQMCQRNGVAHGVGIDMTAAAIQAGNEILIQEGLTHCIQLIHCNASELQSKADMLKDVEVATAFFVLHELCDGKQNLRALEFLRAFRQTLPGVIFHIIEPVRPTPEEMRERPGPAIEYFLFHDLSRQVPMGRAEWMDLFMKAGFSSIQEGYIDFARTSIFTVS